jgi:hypothetical protein
MPSLRSVLLANIGPTSIPTVTMGSDGKHETEVSPVPPLDRDKLKRDLSAVNKDNSRYFFVCVAMVVLLFLVSIGIILTNLSKPDIIKVAMAAFGISSAGLITMMIKLWREKSNVELLILLAINMDAETLKTIVAVLIKRL